MADHKPAWLDVGARIEVQWDIVDEQDGAATEYAAFFSYGLFPPVTQVQTGFGWQLAMNASSPAQHCLNDVSPFHHLCGDHTTHCIHHIIVCVMRRCYSPTCRSLGECTPESCFSAASRKSISTEPPTKTVRQNDRASLACIDTDQPSASTE